jgi:hypothetical protein
MLQRLFQRPSISTTGFAVLTISLFGHLSLAHDTKSKVNPSAANQSIYIKLDVEGKVLTNQTLNYDSKSWACVKDTRTQLTWEVKTDDGGLQDRNHTYTWYDNNENRSASYTSYKIQGNDQNCASRECDTTSYINAINSLNLCGKRDWRLPTREELRSLVDYSIPYPGPTIQSIFFPNTIAQFYWSSTADAGDEESAWGIGFAFGYDYAYFKADAVHVRLVSGQNNFPNSISNETICQNKTTHPSTQENRFVRNNDGTVFDRFSGNTWMQCSLGQKWKDGTCYGNAQKVSLPTAQTVIKKNYPNWRLPRLNELTAILELRCINPSINQVIFPNTPATDFWTATDFVNRYNYAWLVNFLYAESHVDHISKNALVRLVKP